MKARLIFLSIVQDMKIRVLLYYAILYVEKFRICSIAADLMVISLS